MQSPPPAPSSGLPAPPRGGVRLPQAGAGLIGSFVWGAQVCPESPLKWSGTVETALRTVEASLGCPPVCRLLQPGSETGTPEPLTPHVLSKVGASVPISQTGHSLTERSTSPVTQLGFDPSSD